MSNDNLPLASSLIGSQKYEACTVSLLVDQRFVWVGDINQLSIGNLQILLKLDFFLAS